MENINNNQNEEVKGIRDQEIEPSCINCADSVLESTPIMIVSTKFAESLSRGDFAIKSNFFPLILLFVG